MPWPALLRLPRWFARSIRTRLTASFLLMVLLTALLLGTTAYLISSRYGRARTWERLEAAAAAKESQIRQWTDSLQRELEIPLSLPDTREVIRYLLTAESANPVSHDLARNRLRAIFQAQLGVDPAVDRLFLLSAEGNVLVSTHRAEEGEFRGFQPYHMLGLDRPGLLVQSISFSSASEGSNRVIAVHPVPDSAGRPRGVLCVRARLDPVNRILLGAHGLGVTGRTYLVGHNGVLLTATGEPHQRPGGTHLSSAPVRESLSRRDGGRARYLDRGQAWLCASRWMADLEVVLLAEQTEAEALRPVVQLAWLHVLAAVGAVALALPFSAWFSASLVRPLQRLTESVRAAGPQGLPAYVPEDRRDEIGILAASFNRMSGRLHEVLVDLREREARLAAIFDGVNEAIFIHDARTGAIVEVNRAAVEWFGWSAAEFPSLTVGHLSTGVPPFTQEEAMARLHRVREEGPQVFEWQARHRDGRTFWIEIHVRWAELTGQERLLVTARRIDDRKRAEVEREELQRQLLQSQKMETIGHLAGGVAHDFNNLLCAILGYADLLLTDPGFQRPADRESVGEILRAAERARHLTQQLLSFSRKQTLSMRVFPLNDMVVPSLSLLRRLLGETVTVETVLGRESGWVRADPHHLEQVLLNLAVNARDAMPGGGRLRIQTAVVALEADYTRLHPEVSPGNYVMLSVGDTGAGMTAEVQARLFEPFFTTKPKGRGTGLGLSVVYGIVRQHGGSIAVSTEVGVGTTFRIYLPAVGPEPEVAAPAPPAALSAASPRPAGAGTALVLDDDPEVGRMVAAQLRLLDYTVYQAGNLTEAEELLALHPEIRLLVTDVVMPESNGRAAFERLRQRQPALEAVFMSGYTDDVIVHHGVLEPGLRFLAKPFTLRELAAKLAEVPSAFPLPPAPPRSRA